MSTASAYLTIRGIDVDVIYKNIKNLHIGVYPPLGRVRVAAPHRKHSALRSCVRCRWRVGGAWPLGRDVAHGACGGGSL